MSEPLLRPLLRPLRRPLLRPPRFCRRRSRRLPSRRLPWRRPRAKLRSRCLSSRSRPPRQPALPIWWWWERGGRRHLRRLRRAWGPRPSRAGVPRQRQLPAGDASGLPGRGGRYPAPPGSRRFGGARAPRRRDWRARGDLVRRRRVGRGPFLRLSLSPGAHEVRLRVQAEFACDSW